MFNKTIKGIAKLIGNSVDTDMILPGKYLTIIEPAELAKHVFEGYDLNFGKTLNENTILVAGSNFGCGSSREHAPVAIKAKNVPLIIAESFARIFFRNAINIALPVIEWKEAHKYISENDELVVNVETGEVQNITKNLKIKIKPLPPNILKILESGGLIEMVKRTHVVSGGRRF